MNKHYILAGVIIAGLAASMGVAAMTLTVNSATDVQAEVQSGMHAKVTVRGWDDAKKQEIQAKTETVLQNNSHITAADVAPDSVSVTYAAPAKLFGLFDMNMDIHVTSDANGKVSVRFPWYKFLVTSSFSNIAEAMNGVFQSNQNGIGFVKADGSTDAQIKTLNNISAVLKAQYDLAVAKK